MKKFVFLFIIVVIGLIVLDFYENRAVAEQTTITVQKNLKSVFLTDTLITDTASIKDTPTTKEEVTEPSDTTYSFLNEGIASWYADPNHKLDKYDGKKTASGEIMDTWAFTCAYNNRELLRRKALVRVTNLSNNKSVIVKINDTGGFGRLGRIIDLSYIAKQTIGMDGLAKVRVELVHIKEKL